MFFTEQYEIETTSETKEINQKNKSISRHSIKIESIAL